MPANTITELKELFQRAESFRKAKQFPQAINAYIQLISHAPRHWPAYYKMGVLLNEIGRKEAAIVAVQRAVDLAPDNASIYITLGVYLKNMGKRKESMNAFNKALSLEPNNIYALFNKGEQLLRMNESKQALMYFDTILRGDKDAENIKAISQWLRAVARLTLGDYQNAWEDYESRIHHPTTTFPELIGEKWIGQPMEGKTIFLAYEQRFGDVIQFSRFIPKLVELGAKVILQTPQELMRLFRSLGYSIQLIEYKEPLPEYDYCQLVTSIPAILNYSKEEVGISNYLDVDITQERPELPMRKGTRHKVGLIWSGKPTPNRSIPLTYYTPLLRHRNVSFYSFQLGDAKNEIKALAVDWLIHDLSPQINDFYDSSLFMKEMDLIITIDTAAAHQAGALGVPVWLMLIYYSDWRWGNAGDETTAWYPSMRIFRQTEYESWDGAANQLYTAFAERFTDSIMGKDEN